MTQLLAFEDYKEFIRAMVEENRETRGYLTKLAEAANCQKSYLSQVLRSKVQLTPEHAMGLCQFWGLNEIESDYFLNLVFLGRTDFAPLKRKVLQKLNILRKQNDHLGERYSKPKLQGADHQVYYSSWIYAAIHISLSLKECRSVNSIAQRLALSPELVRSALMALEEMGIARRSGQSWELGVGSIHLPQDSPMNFINHQNWRLKACQDSIGESDGIHYTSVQSLSSADFGRLKQILLSTLDQGRRIIEPSPARELVCLNVDYFKL